MQTSYMSKSQDSLKLPNVTVQIQVPETVQKVEEPHHSPTIFVTTYLKFACFVGISPFWLAKVQNKYEIRRSRIQKVYSTTVYCLAFLVYFTGCRRALVSLTKGNPVRFFQFFRSWFGTVYKILVCKALWKDQVKILTIIEYLDTCPFLSKCRLPKLLASKATLLLIFGIYAIVGVMFGITSTAGTFMATANLTQYSHRINLLVAESRLTFFLSYNEMNELTPLDYFLIPLIAIAMGFRYIVGLFSDLYILTWVLTLLYPVKKFGDSLNESMNNVQLFLEKFPSRKVHFKTIACYYNTLRNFSERINFLNGLIYFYFIFEAIFAYPVNFYELAWNPVFMVQAILVLFYSTLILILIGSSEISRQVQRMRSWIYENQKCMHLTSSEIILLLDDLNQNSVGVSVSGIFTINYYFVGTVTGLVITFFIIRLQWSLTEEGNW